jgi:hypothetical protein
MSQRSAKPVLDQICRLGADAALLALCKFLESSINVGIESHSQRLLTYHVLNHMSPVLMHGASVCCILHRSTSLMTAVTIDSEDPRSIKAVEIAAGAAAWLTCQMADGQIAFRVPSQHLRGRRYVVTCQRCDCADAQRWPGQACKHQLAVRLFVALQSGSQTKHRKEITRPHPSQPE